MVSTNNPQNINVSGNSLIHLVDELLAESAWPQTVSEALPIASKYFGLSTDDGEAYNRSVETTSIGAHQGANQRVISTGGSMTLEVTALEDNPITRELYYGVKHVAGKATVSARAIKTMTVIYDSKDTQAGYEKNVRYVGIATITPNGPIQYTATGAATYPLLFTYIGDISHLIDTE